MIILAIVFMVMDRKLEAFGPIRTALALPLAPLQYLVSAPIVLYNDLQSSLSSHRALVNENLQLKAERLLLHAQMQRLLALETENNYLKSLLQSSRQLKSKTLIAELLTVNFEPFVNQVVLNKGKRDGVYIGQPVLDASGIMGQVIQVGPITSRVLLINDTRSGVSVQNVRTGMRAIAVGDTYSGRLRLMYVAKTVDIKLDDLFLTSGLSSQYPEGYPVGKVVAITKSPVKQFAEIYLQPSAHLTSSREVLLVRYQKNA